MVYALIFAGGVGRLMLNGLPKQFLKIHGKLILAYTKNYEAVDKIVLASVASLITLAREYYRSTL